MFEVNKDNKETDKKADQEAQDTSKSMNQEQPDLVKVHKSTDFDLKK